MKILILTDYYPPDKIGGVGEIAKNLRIAYEAAGHEVWVLTTGANADDPRVIRSSASLNKGIFINNIEALKLIRKHGIEVVNMHQSTTSLFLLAKHIPFLWKKKFPRIINSFQVSYFSEFHNIRAIEVDGRRFTPTRKEYVEKWIYAPVHILLDWIGYVFADVITVVSSENKKEFERTYGRLSRKPIHVIPNGVDISNFAPGKPHLDRAFLGKLKGKTVLLYVGVFRVRKRVFNLLFALRRVVQQNSNVVLVLVGGGRAYEDDILALIKQLGLDKNVIFVGSVPNEKVIEYMNAADVFCTLSSYEGMPVAILEAMASGKAILTSRVSGMVDLVSDGKDGYLTEVDDIDEISKKLMSMVASPDKTAKMGERARAKIERTYTWTKVAAQYAKVFKVKSNA